MDQGALLGPEALRQLEIVVRRVLREVRNEAGNRGSSGTRVSNRWAVLDEDLYAADSHVEGQTTAVASLWAVGSDGVMYDTGQDVTLVNRFENISIPADTLIKVEWLNGEWSPYASDCPLLSSSSGAGGGGGISSITPPEI